MSGRTGTARGMSAAELAAAVAELQPLCGASVLDVMPIAAPPAVADLLLVVQREDGSKHFVHLAPGGARARVTATAQRFGKEDFGRGPTRDLLQQQLRGATLTAISSTAGERRCELAFATANGERVLAVELFSARGLWVLLDANSTVLAMSRMVETSVRTLRLGDHYAPPPPVSPAPPHREQPMRFEAPVLPSIDAFFTSLDRTAAATTAHDALVRAASRARRKAGDKAEGLARQLEAAERTDEMRTRADLMLAYAHTAKRGATEMTVVDPVSGEPIALQLDPARPVTAQAQALYDKARRLTDGRNITTARMAEAEAAAATLDGVLAELTAITPADPDFAARIERCRAELQRLRALPAAKSKANAKARAQATRPNENYRRFASIEGYQILVGRSNQQNDRLTMRTANGNDLWLHVGGGRAGSHVVVRLPKQKTARLETLLDAATLAVHFSKARGERRIDVIYTQRKHIRKPKGLPAGAVVPSRTRTVAVDLEPERLRRLLDSAEGDES